MIVRLKGILDGMSITETTRYADISTDSGLTYRVILPTRMSLGEIGDEVKVFTSLQIREDSNQLYGFTHEEERELFERLISVSGIGPKIALGLLSIYTSEELTRLIVEGDHISISKAPGIGPKGAKKIVLELAGILASDEQERELEEGKQVLRELRDALRSLGFKGDELKSMEKKGEEIIEGEEDISIEALLGKVLRG